MALPNKPGRGKPRAARRYDMAKKESVGGSLKRLILFKLNFYTAVFILLCVAMNVAGNFVSTSLKLPVWLDTIGTMAVAIALGPLGASITAALSQSFMGFFSSSAVLFIHVAIAMGLLVGFLYPRKDSRELLETVSLAIVCGLACALLCTPIDLLHFRGYTGNIWGNALYDMLSNYNSISYFNTMLAEAFLNIPDKVLSLFIAIGMVNMFRKLQKHIDKKRRAKKATIISMTVVLALLLPALPESRSEAADTGVVSEYEEEIYDSYDGLPTSEINAVAQTRDGYLWVGTYAGLFRYDGVKFEDARVHSAIRNVKELFVDSRGDLWIGTNDSGLVRYDLTQDKAMLYNTDNGLSSDSVRFISEDSNGNIYAATDRELCRVTSSGEIKCYSEWTDITHVTSMVSTDDGGMLGVTYSGILFLIRDDLLVFTSQYTEEDGVIFCSVAYDGKNVLVGTTGVQVLRYTLKDDRLIQEDEVVAASVSYFNSIVYSRDFDLFFFCCENGMGYMDPGFNEIVNFVHAGIEGNVMDVCIDAQQNVWFASNKHGLVKYSQSPFRNIFRRMKIADTVVNAMLIDGDLLYVGSDTGIHIIDLADDTEIKNELNDVIGNGRVRNIYKDSAGNLWFCVYRNEGLVRQTPEGRVEVFNNNITAGIPGRYRFVYELSDHRLLVSGSGGIAFIEGGRFTKSITAADGLNNTTILSVAEREDGSILAASDGDGIYIIKGDRVVGHIGKAEGLRSGVVMKIVPCTGGYIYVTSNALYYDNGTVIRRLDNFPYNNNYDVSFDDSGNAWVTSSAGMYVVSEEKLLKDEKYTCTLLNTDWGLVTTFTANSFQTFKDGVLYLCCTDGIRAIDTRNYSQLNAVYPLHLKSVETEDQVYTVSGNKVTIPSVSGRISFNIAVNNFSLSDPLVHYYLEGTGDPGITCHQGDITPLSFTNLPFGTYTFHINVLDEVTGAVICSTSFEVEKEAMMYELPVFRVYLAIIIILNIFYILWFIFTLISRAHRIRGLQAEIVTDPMTGILNKAGSHKIIGEACEKEIGTLLMIDLDSFKLVNDLYGHDMGDKILIRFAQLIQESTRAGDLCGRLGGDEFIAFMKNTVLEDDVAKVCSALNKGIVKSAKEFMGEDMNIPLGASIGAVRVPADGNVFDDVFRLADKALYIVKQNGKHGYAFYQKNAASKNDATEETEANNLAHIKKIIGERNEGKGAFLVNFDRFQVLYKYLNRSDRANRTSTGFLRIFITRRDDEAVPDDVKDSFEEALLTNLKKNDVISVYAGNFFVLFVGATDVEYEIAVKRVIKVWNEAGDYEKDYVVSYEIDNVG